MKTLIIIDMQNELAIEKEIVEILPKIKKKIDKYISEGNPVVFTCDTRSEACKIIPELEVTECEHIEKQSIGYMGWERIIYSENVSRYRDVTEAEIVGVFTDSAVVANALILKSVYPNAIIAVDANCCIGTTPKAHQSALLIMKSCEINVIEDNTIKITNIIWDTEDNGDVISQEELGLPTEVEIETNDLIEQFDLDEEDDIGDYIADYLSDKYEYCVISFETE